MRGAPITIKCDCGQIAYVPYGDRWECLGCGKRWNTGQIPAEEYWGIMREMRGYRLRVVGVALAILLVFLPLVFFVSEAFLLSLPIALAGWFILYMPFWRRKVRRRARSLPTWNLHPE